MSEQEARLAKRLKSHPCDTDVLLRRAGLYRSEQHWDAALADCERAARCAPQLQEVQLERARVLVEAGWDHSALVVLDLVLSQQPNNGVARLLRARSLAKLENNDAASREYQQALALIKRPTPGHYLEWAKLVINLGNTRQALRILDQGQKRLGPLMVLQQAAIEVELGRRRYDAALSRLNSLTRSGAPELSLLVRRGEILELAGRHKQAHQTFHAALTTLEARPAHRRNTVTMKALKERLRSHLSEKEITDAKTK